MLDRVSGPECPKCGYEGSDLISTTDRKKWKAGICISREVVEHRECQWCGNRYVQVSGKKSDAAIYLPVRCPDCDSPRTHVTSSRAPLRYHECDDCGQSFKSYEH